MVKFSALILFCFSQHLFSYQINYMELRKISETSIYMATFKKAAYLKKKQLNNPDQKFDPHPVSDKNDWDFQPSFEKIARSVVESNDLYVHKISWKADRIEITISCSDDKNNPIGPAMSDIEKVHRSLYSELEKMENINNLISRYEVFRSSNQVTSI